MNLFEDDGEETEEQRKKRQADNAAAAAGFALGATAALIQQALRKEEIYEDEPWEESQGFEQTM